MYSGLLCKIDTRSIQIVLNQGPPCLWLVWSTELRQKCDNRVLWCLLKHLRHRRHVVHLDDDMGLSDLWLSDNVLHLFWNSPVSICSISTVFVSEERMKPFFSQHAYRSLCLDAQTKVFLLMSWKRFISMDWTSSGNGNWMVHCHGQNSFISSSSASDCI